jgi:hypothetical protein
MPSKPSESSGWIYPNTDEGAGLGDNEKKGVVGAIIIVVFLLMATELVVADVAFIGALVTVMILQILTLPETLAGMANEGMVTVAVLFIVRFKYIHELDILKLDLLHFQLN